MIRLFIGLYSHLNMNLGRSIISAARPVNLILLSFYNVTGLSANMTPDYIFSFGDSS